MSAVTIEVTNKPISRTVPVMPTAAIVSPTLNGRKTRRKTPGGKVGKQPRPCRPNGEARRRQQRGERGRLDPEDAEDGDEEQDLEQDSRAGLDVRGERDVEMAQMEKAAKRGPDELDDPAAHDPERGGAQKFPGRRDQIHPGERLELRCEL